MYTILSRLRDSWLCSLALWFLVRSDANCRVLLCIAQMSGLITVKSPSMPLPCMASLCRFSRSAVLKILLMQKALQNDSASVSSFHIFQAALAQTFSPAVVFHIAFAMTEPMHNYTQIPFPRQINNTCQATDFSRNNRGYRLNYLNKNKHQPTCHTKTCNKSP